eukprot:jgi/Chlat1/2508/Chrsp175S02376
MTEVRGFEYEFESDDGEAEEEEAYGDDDDDADFSFVASPIHTELQRKLEDVSVDVLDADMMQRHRQEEVRCVSEILNLPPSVAGALLRHFKWNREQLLERYIEDAEGVCQKAGVHSRQLSQWTASSLSEASSDSGSSSAVQDHTLISAEFICPVCTESCLLELSTALGCGHRFCFACWEQYLEGKVLEGPSCIFMTCIAYKCSVLVDEDVVHRHLTPGLWQKYSGYLERSYVDNNPSLHWCPAPSCGRAISVKGLTGVNNTAVRCACGFSFCYKCNQESHVPVNCDTLRKWLIKCKDDSETANWLAANTLTCPSCKSAIQKNGGCNHMVCKQCRHEFCWVCAEPWKEHGESTGGYYACNRYDPTRVERKHADASKIALERYLHYYHRYSNHAKSRELEAAAAYGKAKMEAMQSKPGTTYLDVAYIKDAYSQLLDCRRTLQFTYVFGYYMGRGERKTRFEFYQEDLEKSTEALSGLLEKPAEQMSRLHVLNATALARSHLRNLLDFVEPTD